MVHFPPAHRKPWRTDRKRELDRAARRKDGHCAEPCRGLTRQPPWCQNPPVSAAPVSIALLGRFSVRRGEEEVPSAAFGGRLTRTLLRLLLTRRGQLVPKDVLVEALWGDRPPADPVRNVEILVVRARRALGDATMIATAPGGYVFRRTADCEVDAERFAELADAGRRHLLAGRPAAALGVLRHALDHWGGEPLPEDAYADWAQQPRRELQRRYVDVLEGAAAAALAVGEPAEAVAHAERAIAEEPLRETAHLLLAQALAASGDRAAALDVLAAFEARLADELGLALSPESEQLRARILRGEPLSPPAPLSPAVGRARSSPAAPQEPLFVGREVELDAVLATASGEAHAVVVLAGPAGAGKSRLLAEAAARSPVPVLSVRAFVAEQEQSWSLGRRLVREALGLDVEAARAAADHAAVALAEELPELAELRPLPRLTLDPESRRALALEGAVQIVAASRARLILADDAQWADATSLRLLTLAAERTAGGLAIAYRPEEVQVRSPLAQALETLRRRGCREIALGPLSLEALQGLIADSGLAQVVAEETDGTPLAVMEVLRALAREGAVARRGDGRWFGRGRQAVQRARQAARAGQRSAIILRAGRLPPDRREVLARLALLGREAPARLLARAAGTTQAETLEALDTLIRTGLARLGSDGWATSHDLVAEAVTAMLSPADRIALHGGLAGALRADGADPSEVARHLVGAGDRPAAARAYAEAAVAALGRFDNDDAERLASSGLALGPDEATELVLLESRGEARARRGELAGAEADLRRVLGRTPKGAGWSRTAARLAWLVAGGRDYAEGLEMAEAAIAASGRDRAARAHALAVAGRIDLNLGELRRCRTRVEEALRAFEDIGDAEGIARVVDIQAIVAFEEGRLREAVGLFERAATLFTSRGDLFRAVMPLATRSRALSQMARYQEALADSDRAVALARMLRYPEGECYALLQRAYPLVGLGRPIEAEAAADAAVAMASRLGHREWLSAANAARASARQALGALAGAEADFRSALELARGMPIHTAVAASGLAALLVAVGRSREASTYVAQARAASERNQSAYHLARCAEAEVAAALGDPRAAALAREAIVAAETDGHLDTVPRLRAVLARGPASGQGRSSKIRLKGVATARRKRA